MYSRRVLFRVPLFVVVTLCVASSLANAKGAGRPSFAPPAAWVRDNALPEVNTPPSGESQPIEILISDRQIRVGKDQATFWRRAYRVLSHTGVENGSQIEWEFDPYYERLVIHFVRIHRGGGTVDALRPKEIKVVQRETDLDARIYNGAESAILFLHDVRVGDVIDYAYTIKGSNPILRGRFSTRFHLAEFAPTARLSVRLLVEGQRSIDFKAHGIELSPSLLKSGSTTEYLFTRHDLPAIVVEDELPSWFDPRPSVEASEFRSWSDVATWASELFERTVETSAGMREAVARFATDPDLASRALSAIRFVQDDVRYLGIELGENSHQPFSPKTVLARRFGDCKDKSLLLVTFLRQLGIDARVALVDTDLGAAVAEHAPSPFAFDHAIVMFRLDGREFFVDPTESMAHGSLADLVPPPFGRALVVSPTSTDLIDLPTPPLQAPLVEERQLYTVSSYDAPVLFEVETVYRQDEASSMRRHLADTPMSQLARNYVNYYAKIDPKITAEREPAVIDEVETNVITVREVYRIPDFWDGDHREFSARLLEDRTTDPRITRRTMPLGLKHPQFVAQTIEVVLPENYDIENDTKEIVSSGFKFTFSSVNLEKRFRLHYEYRTLGDSVAASDMERYRAKLDEVRRLTGYSITRSNKKARQDWKPVAWVLGSAMLGVVGLAVVGVAAVRGPAYLRQLRFRRRQRLLSGEGPSTALPMHDEMERRRYFDRLKCACGGQCGGPQEQNQVRYGGGLVTVFRSSCPTCGRDHRIYFRDA